MAFIALVEFSNETICSNNWEMILQNKSKPFWPFQITICLELLCKLNSVQQSGNFFSNNGIEKLLKLKIMEIMNKKWVRDRNVVPTFFKWFWTLLQTTLFNDMS